MGIILCFIFFLVCMPYFIYIDELRYNRYKDVKKNEIILRAIDDYYSATTTKSIDKIKLIFENSKKSGFNVNSMMYNVLNGTDSSFVPSAQNMNVDGYDNIVKTFEFVFAGWNRIFVLASKKSISNKNKIIGTFKGKIGSRRYLIGTENYDENKNLYVTLKDGIDQFLVNEKGLIEKIANLEMVVKLDKFNSDLIISASYDDAFNILKKIYLEKYKDSIFSQSDANTIEKLVL